mmetsp:Transcript_5156/g.8680  ORF Transcript_5156/g.8680 Transcript_5156/m.8680 type:complete len:233 (-) Transcript_5156:130-828(-)
MFLTPAWYTFWPTPSTRRPSPKRSVTPSVRSTCTVWIMASSRLRVRFSQCDTSRWLVTSLHLRAIVQPTQPSTKTLIIPCNAAGSSNVQSVQFLKSTTRLPARAACSRVVVAPVSSATSNLAASSRAARLSQTFFASLKAAFVSLSFFSASEAAYCGRVEAAARRQREEGGSRWPVGGSMQGGASPRSPCSCLARCPPLPFPWSPRCQWLSPFLPRTCPTCCSSPLVSSGPA